MVRASLVLAAMILASCGPKPEAQAIERAKKAVSDTMRDPEAARFRELRTRYRPAGTLSPLGKTEAGWIVCGEVNGKNAMGGYVGYRQFRFSDPLLPKVDAKPFITTRDPTDFKEPLDPEVWDAYQKVECDGADKRIVADLQNQQLELWSKRTAQELKAAKENYRRALTGE